MKKTGYNSKYGKIAEHFRELILSGEIRSGMRLPTDMEIARDFNVNNRTAAKGMAALVADGLITRSPGGGSVVIRNKLRKPESHAVGVVSMHTGHVYQTMGAEITEGILKHDLYPTWITQSILQESEITLNHSRLFRMLEHFVNDCPHGLILLGSRFIPYDMLSRNLSKVKNMVFIDYYLHKKELPAKYVLSDFKAGARKIANFLHKKGHRRIAVFTDPHSVLEKYGETLNTRLFHNICHYFTSLGGKVDSKIFTRLLNGEKSEQVLKEELPGSDITAMVLAYDAQWSLYVEPVIHSMGLKMPDDLSIVGYYNTPWAEQANPPLTSVMIHEERIGKLAVKMLFDEIEETKIYVKPDLVIRNSVRDLTLK